MDSFWIGSLLVVILTGLYTVLGGLRAVAYTEALQTFILVIGSGLVTFYGLEALGGWSVLRETLGSDMFNLWKPIVPPGVEATWAPVIETDAAGKVVKQAWYFNSNYPWFSMLFCAPVVGLWYWCTDQYIVQRMLGAPNEREARRGAIFASFLKLMPVFIFIIPGMICFALAKQGVNPELAKQLVGPDGTVIRSEAQAAFPLLVKTVMPAGIRGMVVAGLLAALMSSLAGVFNACATLFTMDFYSKMHKGVSEEKLVWIGRVATVVMIGIGILWIPVIRGQKGLYDYLQGMQAYLAPPIFVVFFAGVFWKRLNGPGCMAALIVGFLMGIFRLAIDTPVALSGAVYPEGSFFWVMNKMFFQYYSMLIMAVCTAALFIVSYLTKEPDYDKLAGLTYGTLTREQVANTKASWTAVDVIASGVVLVVIIAAYLYFRG
jgi:SSS family solute:Na+ symporter